MSCLLCMITDLFYCNDLLDGAYLWYLYVQCLIYFREYGCGVFWTCGCLLVVVEI